jgi:hypothetical protein
MKRSMSAVVACLVGVALGCVAKNGSEVQARGTADTSTSAPATRPTNTNAGATPSAGGNAAAQSTARSTAAGDVAGQTPESTAGTPVASDSTRRRHR